MNERISNIYFIVNSDKSLGFIPTLRVGTSTMVSILRGEKDWKNLSQPPKNCQLFSLVRHPYDRWISGTTLVWTNKLELLVKRSFRQLLKDSFKDQHTRPQSWNFDNHQNIKFFKLENIDKMWNWLNFDDPKVHIHKHGLFEHDIREWLIQKADRKKIELLYEEDMQLWRKAI